MERIGEVSAHALIVKQTEDPELPKGMYRTLILSCQVPEEEPLKRIYFLQLKNSSVSKATTVTWFPKQLFLLLFLFGIDY